MNRDESRTDLGNIRIHKNVIASIASLAATEIEGVKTIAKAFKIDILEIFRSSQNLSAIRVEFDKNGEIKLEIPLIVKYGFNIPEVAAAVQENVRNNLEKMTNLTVKDIHINVQGIERIGAK
ncbi:MAG: Asp23/Gls24 family envelope stress response protein [Candidatus Omnitrophica bacterium]|nr:Asp23/Gls24 family envelope stress response protein [Candidatus Omnitrophota bacterium]MDD5654010.1 Asp23/Gls24 family envelope stress response protein [Candidatus Omnitrophota bacterium]